jgi:hypothetical protein
MEKGPYERSSLYLRTQRNSSQIKIESKTFLIADGSRSGKSIADQGRAMQSKL